MNETRSLIAELKSEGEDFEFYPTTDEIMAAVSRDMTRRANEHYSRSNINSFLDIGAGNGKVLKAIREKHPHTELYAIEKSLILCGRLADMAFVIGTDFKRQSLLSKRVGTTFCNPPYSEFEDWAVKIIRESASACIYLVLPVRWEKSKAISDAVSYREAKVRTLGEYSFEDAEDRTARAIVNLIRIDMQEGAEDDAFNRFFDEQFSGLKARYEAANKGKQDDGNRFGARENQKFAALVQGANLLETLVSMYDADMEQARRNYELAAALDVELLQELHVTPKDILACLKGRLEGLRNEYWHELFSRMSAVTDRLCSRKRNALLETLNRNGHVDFTTENAYAVLMWVLKHANDYIDEQLVETFEKMISKANVKNYASNKRVFEGNSWRYNEEKPTHIALEYRLVLERCGGIENRWGTQELSQSASEFIGDLLTVAHNLGFQTDTSAYRLHDRRNFPRGSKVEFYGVIDGKPEVIFEVRAFLNWNMHLRMNQKLALALNVEHGRIRGWIRTPAEAARELNDEKATEVFGSCCKLGAKSLPMLAAAVA